MPATSTPEPPVIVCPKCGAKTGQPCVNTGTGKPFTGFTHRERRKAALNGN